MSDAEEPGSTAEATKSLALNAVDAARESAKWVVGALAAVATVLVAGSQLSNIGALTGWRLAFAVSCAVVGLAALGLVLRKTFNLLLPASLSLDQLADLKWPNGRDPAIRFLSESPGPFLDRATSPADLRDKLKRAYQAEDAALKKHRADRDDDVKREAAEAAGDTRVELEQARRSVLEHAAWARVAFGIRDWERYSVGALAVVGLGLVGFAWAANPPENGESAAQSMRGVTINRADLSGSDLSNLDFTGATLSNVNLRGAKVEGTIFEDVTWNAVTCPDGTPSTEVGESCAGHLDD